MNELNISLYENEIKNKLVSFLNVVEKEKYKKFLVNSVIAIPFVLVIFVYSLIVDWNISFALESLFSMPSLVLCILLILTIISCVSIVYYIMNSNHKLEAKSMEFTNEILDIVFNNLILEDVTKGEINDCLTFEDKNLGNSLTVNSKLRLSDSYCLYNVFGVNSDGRNIDIIFDGLVLVLNDLNDNISESLSKSTSYKLIKNDKGVNILLIPDSEYLIDIYKVKNKEEAYNTIILNLERLYSLINLLDEV